ncbi:acrosomal protein SP-10-like [Anolis carolinensis]|uniref:acrosomal protein SP-10-like n=1 Tax=Anolis carolinensis TaxID=28377 RepID=UPI002F2B4A2F
MERVMLAIICLMLCCGLGEALLCYSCKMFKPGGSCMHTEGFCIAKKQNQCKQVHIYKAAVRNFYRYGCTLPEDKCGTKKVDPSWGTVVTKCCKSKNYCNDPKPE